MLNKTNLFKFYDTFYKNCSDYILISDDKKNIIYYNNKIQELLDFNYNNQYKLTDFFENSFLDSFWDKFYTKKYFETKFKKLKLYDIYFKGVFSTITHNNKKHILITLNKKNLNEELNSDLQLIKIIDSMPDPVLIQSNLEILYSNRSLIDLLETTNKEIYKKITLDFVHPSYLEKAKQNIRNLELNKNLNNKTREYQFITAKGKIIYAEVYSIPIKFKGKSSLISIIRNISNIKKLKENIIERELVFRTLSEFTVSAIFIFQNNKFVVVNQATSNLTGYTQEELLNMNFWDVVHPDYRNMIKKYGLARQQGKKIPERYEFKILAKDGSEIWIDFSAKLISWNGKSASIGTAFNITDRKKAEELLIKSEERFRRLFEYHSIMQFIVDPVSLKIEDANISASKFYGYSLDELKKMRYCDIAMLNADLIKKNINKVFNHKKSHFIVKHKKADGKIIYVEVFPCALELEGKKHLHIMVVDISERIKTEELNRLLTISIEQSPASVVITDSKGSIIYVNSAFEKITGYTKKEAIGQNPRILQSGQHNQSFYQELWTTLLSGKQWHGNIVNKNKQGNLYTEEANIAPIFDEKGNITHFVAIKLDITQKLELEAQYMQSHKMESVGRLAGGIAHDFNNMLSIILNYATLLLNTLDQTSSIYEYVNQIYTTAEKSANLTAQLLTYARKQAVSPKVVDVNEIINDLIKMIRRLIREDIKLIWSPGEKIYHTKIDITQLTQLIINLCVNASDAIEKKGKIEIKTENLEVKANSNNKFNNKHYVVIKVKDNGKGMNNETLEHIFEPFFTTKSIGEGTGLGLSTVYGIVKQNNGIIDVSSKEGKGTEFIVYFPKTNEEKTKEKTLSNKKIKSQNATILLTEDEPSLLEVTRMILEEKGYKVLPASSPEVAINLAKYYSDTISVLITDVIMPGINGFELSEKIKNICPDIKIIYMSGYSEDIISENSILSKSINFIQKPYNVEELFHIVSNTINEK